MNPYWINPSPDNDEWLHSDRAKQQFFALVGLHILLWIISLVGIVFIFIHAQKTAPIQAFTAQGEPAWGTPMPIGSQDTLETQEKFLTLHLKNVFSTLFMRTEKGALPQLKDYVDPELLSIFDSRFNFIANKRGGYSQTFFVEELERISEFSSTTRRVYRIKGVLSAHSLDGASNTPIFLIAALDLKASTAANPLGWVVWAVISVDAKEYYNKERQALIDEVTKPRLKETPNNP